jgi:hypothetical protein
MVVVQTVESVTGVPGGLGLPFELAATRDGGVALIDGQGPNGPTVMQLDSAGVWVRQLGRIGDGPGEYRGPNQLAATASDEIWIYDVSAGRRLVGWSAVTGQPIGTVSPEVNPGGPGLALIPAAVDGFWVQASPRVREGGRGAAARPWAWYLIDRHGTITDSIRPTDSDTLTRTGPRAFATLQESLPHGSNAIIRVRHEQLAFELVGKDGAVLRTVVLDTTSTPQVLEGERQAQADLNEFNQKFSGGMAPSTVVPDRKDAIRWMATDASGRIWILPHARGIDTGEERPVLPVAMPGMPTTRFAEPVRLIGVCGDGSDPVEATIPGVVGPVKVSFTSDGFWLLRSTSSGGAALSRWEFEESLSPCGAD